MTNADASRFRCCLRATYGVEVSLSGFAPWRAEAVTLQVGQERQLDIQLYLGNVQEDIVVRAETRPLNTVVDGVLPAARIEALPLNGRNFLELALLVPGNAPTPVFDPTKTNSVLIVVRRPDGTRRQHHHRRPGQQRRRRRRTAAEPADRCRAGVPDRHESLRRRPGPLGLVGDQRRHALRHQHAPRLSRASSRATMAGRRCRRRWTTRTRQRRSIVSRCRAPSAGRCGGIACSGSAPVSSVIRMAQCWSGRAIPRRGRSREALLRRRCATDSGRCGSIPAVRPADSWRVTPASGRPIRLPAPSSARLARRRSGRTPPIATTASSDRGPLRHARPSSTRSAPASARSSTRRCRSRSHRS